MSNDDYRIDHAVERIDADAVCAECGSVNPDGTLICKTCGNNLRDQRARRVTGELVPDAVVVESRTPSWLGKSLAVLGLLVLLWTALNLGRIEDLMVGAQSDELGDPEQYWSGRDSSTLDGLRDELRSNEVGRQEAQAAQQQPLPNDVIDGRYVLVRDNPLGGRVEIGQAIVKQEGNRILFVALLGRDDTEIRGEARPEGTRIAARDTASVKIRGENWGASGFVQPMEGGGYACFGLSSENDESYSAYAYRVP